MHPFLFVAVPIIVIGTVLVHRFNSLQAAVTRFIVVQLPSIGFKLWNPPLSPQRVNWKIPDKFSDGRTKRSLPNIVLIVADDLGINDLSGGAGVSTPNIDSIRIQGVDFTNAYSGQATCAPARAAIFTGRNPTKVGFEFTPIPVGLAKAMSIYSHSHPLIPNIFLSENAQNAPKMSEMAIPSNVTVLPEALSGLGYVNYLIGKWHLGHSEGCTPLDRDFQETLTFPVGLSKYYPTNHPDVVNAPLDGLFDEFLRENMPFTVKFNNGPSFEADDYMTDYITNRAVDLIEARENAIEPMFLSLTYSAPHNPLQARRSDYDDPEIANNFAQKGHFGSGTKDEAIDRQRVYAAMIKALDRGVGRVVDALKRTNEIQNTLIIFTSDNGGAHYIGVPTVNQPYRGFKGTFYEGGIRVPLFMRWDENFINNYNVKKQLQEPVTHVDLFATIISVASGKYAHGTKPAVDSPLLQNIKMDLDGVDLIPFVIESLKSTNTNDKNTTLLSSLVEKVNVRPHDQLYWRSGHYRAFRYQSFKLQLIERPDNVMWYDLSSDPLEQVNLARLLGITSKSQLESIFHSSFATENLKSIDESHSLVNLMRIYSRMMGEEELHRDPLWKPLMEIAVPIDKCASRPEDEFVYFVN